ncbi:hypothetical protein GCM10010393_56380 [Streptomyces gobitricini]|uniref:Secreted protein n=2 Tax=Streptomyces gobitricini TaxID=68211 RepID=A0ABN3N8K7_9ACTN
MPMRSRALGATAALALAVGGTTLATTTPAAAATCYDSYKIINASRTQAYIPADSWLTTTSACSDINIRAASYTDGRSAKICFQRSNGTTYCQSEWTWLPAGVWKAVATNVSDGVKFKIQLKMSATGSDWFDGRVAA